MPVRVHFREAAKLAGVSASIIGLDVQEGRLSRGYDKEATIDLRELKALYPDTSWDPPEDEPVEAEAGQGDEALWYPSHLELQALWRLDWPRRHAQKQAWCNEHPHLVVFFAELDEPPVFTPSPPSPSPAPPPQSYRAPPPAPSIPRGWVIGIGLLVCLPVSCAIVGSGVEADKARSVTLIQSVAISNGAGQTFVIRPDGEAPRIVVTQASANLSVTYSGAKAGKDEMQIRLTGPGSRGNCEPIILTSSSGVANCSFVELKQASYTFVVSVNGAEAAKYTFAVSDPRRAQRFITDVRIAQSVREGFRAVQDNRQFVGAPTPVGIAIRYDTKRPGDYIDTELYLNGRLLDRCRRFYLEGFQSGDYWCQFDSVGAGSAEFRVKVNGIAAGRYAFSMAATTMEEPVAGEQSAVSRAQGDRPYPPTYNQPTQERRSSNADTPGTVSCVIPSGAEIVTTDRACRDAGGMIY